MEIIKKQEADSVQIIDYQTSMKDDFKKLNVAWINKYFVLEAHDLEQLEQPEKYILEDGGKIFFAKIQEEVVGTCALIKVNNELFELAKMAVSEEHQGRQIGKRLCQYAVEQARLLGAKQIFLESNTKLTPAINLYQKIGFFKVALSNSPFQRANIKMMLNL
jgi:N-acetylglutamate synthase-like GNAT family acetyltransferase